ncbi:MAG: DMT family transporter [Proteobacteria bacterium]|nr:DMT family transporter [Pseudomonadota bacterium]
MLTKIAYLSVILIWATTPLAIKWSSESVGYLFGITARMVLGMLVAYVILIIVRQRMPWHRQAIYTYIAAGLGIYATMGSIYWGAQFIPSGWVSVVFGLSPIFTGAMAAISLKEDALSTHKILGIGLGFAGLVVVFGHGANLGPEFIGGVIACVFGTSCHALSAVTIKRIDANVGGFSLTAGGLSFAVPLLLVSFVLVDGWSLPVEIPLRAGLSILYLGIVSSAIGFALYYYILKRMTVSRVSLIALITPIMSLGLGNFFNGEPLSVAIILGAGCIVCGLLIYEFGPSLIVAMRNQTLIARFLRRGYGN